MIDTSLVIKYLEKHGKTSFEQIWEKISPKLLKQFDKIKDDNELKTNLFSSMIENFKLIMIGNNVWDLKINYTIGEVEDINNSLLGGIETIGENDMEIPLTGGSSISQSEINKEGSEESDFGDEDFETKGDIEELIELDGK